MFEMTDHDLADPPMLIEGLATPAPPAGSLRYASRRTMPPGNGPVDQRALVAGLARFAQAGGGH